VNLTPTEAAARLRAAVAQQPAAIASSLELRLLKVRDTAVRSANLTGLLRKLYGSDRMKLAGLITVKVAPGSSAVDGSLVLEGAAALQEAGGRTKAHQILPKAGDFLAWSGPRGTVFLRSVQHHGSRVPASPFVEPVLQAAAGDVDKDAAAATEKLLQTAVG
jgi:hypothetical protein